METSPFGTLKISLDGLRVNSCVGMSFICRNLVGPPILLAHDSMWLHNRSESALNDIHQIANDNTPFKGIQNFFKT